MKTAYEATDTRMGLEEGENGASKKKELVNLNEVQRRFRWREEGAIVPRKSFKIKTRETSDEAEQGGRFPVKLLGEVRAPAVALG